MFQPSALFTCASYQATGPSHGWCEFTLSRVMPSGACEPITACAFEPGKALSSRGPSATIRSPTCFGGPSLIAPSTLFRSNMSGILCANPAAMSFPPSG